jgi:hypothetical protein
VLLIAALYFRDLQSFLGVRSAVAIALVFLFKEIVVRDALILPRWQISAPLTALWIDTVMSVFGEPGSCSFSIQMQ